MERVIVSFLVRLRLPLSKVNINAVMQPDNRIISKSIGAKTIPGKLSNIIPVPILYKCPLSSIISPIYIRSVIAEAAIEGTPTEITSRFPKRNEPVNTPNVTPKRTKNTVISAADKGDT